MTQPARAPRPEDPILHVPEAAAYLRISQPTLRRLVRTNSIRFSRVGRVLKFRKSDLDALVEAGGADLSSANEAFQKILHSFEARPESTVDTLLQAATAGAISALRVAAR